jgi:glycosyltransferase involved in cell wall biosynthesis
VNVVCFTDSVIRARLDEAVARHVATDVSVVIAAKQEAPSIADIIDRTRRYATEIVVVDGHSTDGTPDLAQRSGARVLVDGGCGKGEAIRRAIPQIRTPITVFMDADGSHDPEDIPLLVEPILAGRADHVSASRLRGGSSELHGGFDEFFRLTGSSFITACVHQLALQLPVERKPERLPSDPDVGPPSARPARESDHDRAGDDHQDAAPRLPDD